MAFFSVSSHPTYSAAAKRSSAAQSWRQQARPTWASTMEAGEASDISSSRTSCKASSSHQRRRLSVAVIGAGAAGLVAARELQKEGHQVVVFEQESAGIGGVWRYSQKAEDEDPLGLSPHRTLIHSSMYLSLRTNLPREIMGFLDFPFLPKHHDCSRDARRYPGHAEVLSYLQDYAVHFGLLPFVRFGQRVTRISINKPLVNHGPAAVPAQSTPFQTENMLPLQWSVVSEEERGCLDATTDLFDAVVICNGHYFQPKLASIPGIEKWPGKQLHSHNYREPHPFVDQIVVVIGNSSSGSDIAREIAAVAKEVHLVGRTWDSCVDMEKPVGSLQNLLLHPMVQSAHENGKLIFEDGASVAADVILYCTGYAYSLPFLDTDGIVNVDSDYVGPLYQHVFPPLLAPSLSFVGLPFKVIPFPLMQLQSKWIAMALSGKVLLPSKQQMFRCTEEFYEGIKARGISKSKIHDLSSCQFEYDNWLADQCGCEPIEHWRIQIYKNSSKGKRNFPDSYRDEWTDQEMHDIAIADLLQLAQSVYSI
eukprot:c16108_g1_i2 orf=97-1701(-)